MSKSSAHGETPKPPTLSEVDIKLVYTDLDGTEHEIPYDAVSTSFELNMDDMKAVVVPNMRHRRNRREQGRLRTCLWRAWGTVRGWFGGQR